jgi:hypothetical protein
MRLFGQFQKGNSAKFAACREFGEVGFSRAVHREFIAAGYCNGGVGLPSLSSSFSFPELLVGFPRAHPLLLTLFTRVPRTACLRTSP